jgi:hypothetical protein
VTKGSNRCPTNGLQVALWTKSVIKGDQTIQRFVDAAKKKYNVQVDSMSVNRI